LHASSHEVRGIRFINSGRYQQDFSGKANALHRSHEVNAIPLAEIEVKQYEIDGIFL